MYFHAIQENLSLPVNEERWISIGRNTNQCEFDVEIVTTIMAIVMLAEVYLITPKILQVLKTQDGAKVKEQFLRMVHSLFLQVATNVSLRHEYTAKMVFYAVFMSQYSKLKYNDDDKYKRCRPLLIISPTRWRLS